MRNSQSAHSKRTPFAATSRFSAVIAILLCIVLTVQGCFDPVYPQLDREARVMDALNARDSRQAPPSPLTPADAVVYALANNLDAKVAEIETSYYNESAIAAKRRMLPSLTMRYSMDHSNHPSARWSESTRSGNQSLESSYSSDPNSRQGEAGLVWNLIDFGVGYLRARQQGERIRHSVEQQRRVKQQVVLDVLANYWRASAAITIADEAESIRKELEEQAEAIRDSVEMRILSGAEGARRELAVHGGLAELEQWRRAATQAKLELGRVMGCGNSLDFKMAAFPDTPATLPPLPGGDPSALQAAALQRRPELFQQDVQERIAVDEARIALLQMAPNANLSLSAFDDPDKFLEWGNWMTVGARVSWNLFNIPARITERRMAKLQGETAKQKGLALAAGIMAQVGIAYSEWRVSTDYAAILEKRADARKRLVDALAAGEKDGQTRPGEVLQERVRLLSEKAASLRASAEARIAGARLANAIGLDVDECGRLLWKIGSEEGVDILYTPEAGMAKSELMRNDAQAAALIPENMSGLKVVKAEDFLTPDSYFTQNAKPEARSRSTREESVNFDAPLDDFTETGDKAKQAESVEKYKSYAKQRPVQRRDFAETRPETVPEDRVVREASATPEPKRQIEPPLRPEPEARPEAPRIVNFESVRQPAQLATVQLPPSLEGESEAAFDRERDTWDQFDNNTMMELAKTSYSEEIGDTHISEDVPHLMGREMAKAPVETPSSSLRPPVQAATPTPAPALAQTRQVPVQAPVERQRPAAPVQAVHQPKPGTERVESVPAQTVASAAPQVEYPEEIQAQVPPGMEGFYDMRKVPLTSFIGPTKKKGDSAPPQMPERREPRVEGPPVPLPVRPLEIGAGAPPGAYEPTALPSGSLRPPDHRELERLEALAPLAPLEVRSSLRPPTQRSSARLTPPVVVPSPGDFADSDVGLGLL